ncbi:hypothetical protein ONS95_008549 [Cadophora gregata]|uniref:uncharacterized protein n=1 Tax=Cadophora gregata TaxID=51156 RepID=UPI0026DA80F4|nr:uncharacterized protein ONS95_008549 [Cadophora gregata]KAK0100210.1 hypothetical protein ONS95_008549 [Cadophora gregata]KAK0114840.1 hypothetical protein ONS96_013322 [Cadophora gregata f. sp. sojae]
MPHSSIPRVDDFKIPGDVHVFLATDLRPRVFMFLAMTQPSEIPSVSPTDNADGTTNKRRTKKRIRAFTAEDRATHRVIEKQRREALNERFLDLARLLPALADCRRLSKSIIVHESIAHLQTQRTMFLAAASEVQTLIAENLELIAEVNRWRGQFSDRSPCQPKPLGDGVLALLKVDQEVFGTFPAGFGDNSTGDGDDEEHRGQNHDLQQTEGIRHSISDSLPRPEVPMVLPQNIVPITSPSDPTLLFTGLVSSTSTGVPTSSTLPCSELQTDLYNPSGNDLFTIRGTTYGEHLDSTFGIPPMAHQFDDTIVNQNVFPNVPMPMPEINYGPSNVFLYGWQA